MITTTRNELERLKENHYIASGSEAEIADYDANTVIKIFNDVNRQNGVPIDKKRKEKVVKYFIKTKFPQNVIGPLEDVYADNEFAAYIMMRLSDDDPVRQLTKRNYLKKNRFSNKDAVSFALKLARIVDDLHKRGYIIGDINDQNFSIMQNEVYAIDTDSYGIKGQIYAVTYTENYTAPEAYKANGVIELTEETDNFALAVLCFYILAQVHPFGGNYAKQLTWRFKERIENKVSVLGPHGVGVRSVTPSWNWISPQLLKKFLDIFEGNCRESILSELEDLYNHMTYCKKHNGYYYSKFGECPVCNQHAKVQTQPIKQAPADTTAAMLKVIFESDDIETILNDKYYLSKDHNIVHRRTGRRKAVTGKANIEFTKDGNYILEIRDDVIVIQDDYTHSTYPIQKQHKSHYDMTDDTLYYVDQNNRLKSMQLTRKGTYETSEDFVFNPIFKIVDEKTRFIASFYPKKAIVVENGGQTHEFDCNDPIIEYVLRYDESSKRWLFIYEKKDGSFRTLVFGNKRILVDNSTWVYSALPLSGICLAGNTIYEPGNKEIIGLNIASNKTKAFPCSVVTENSHLEFSNGGFTITNPDKIYTFGK